MLSSSHHSRIWHTAILALCATALCHCSPASKTSAPSPQNGIVWENTSVTGEYEHAKGEFIATFPFRVEGSEPVTITQVEPDCSCVLSADQNQTHLPGSQGAITAHFMPGIRTGKQERSVKVHVAGVSEPQILQLHLTVPEVLRLSSGNLTWNKDEKSESKSIELEAVPPLVIKSWNTSSDAFQVEVEPLEEHKRYRITVTPKETATPRSSLLILETDFPYRPWDKVTIALKSGA